MAETWQKQFAKALLEEVSFKFSVCKEKLKKKTFSGLTSYSHIYVSGPHLENLEYWKKLGANISTSNGTVAEAVDVIFLAIKPHILATAIANIYDSVSDCQKVHNKLFVSILAGITIQALENVCFYIFPM